MKNQVIDAYRKRSNGHFFSPDTMRFFGSRVSSDFEDVGGVMFFITSELDCRGRDRRYTVRRLDLDGRVDECGEFRQYRTLAQAKSAMRHHASEARNA